MKIHVKLNLKTIVVLFVIVLLLVIIACHIEDQLKIGYWNEGLWDVEAWGN